MSVLGLGEGGKPGVCCVFDGEGLGTTQVECKVLIISGRSETFEEVLLTTEWGWEEGERDSRLGGSPYRVPDDILSILTWNPLGCSPNSSILPDKSNGFSAESLAG